MTLFPQKPVLRQRGLTLIEIMVALTLSLLLLAGMIQVFQSNKQSYRVQDALSRVQESGRFAVDFIARDLRMAGFQGCVSMEDLPTTVIARPPAPNFSPGNVMVAYDAKAANWVPALPATIPAVAGTDVITVQGASGAGIELVGNVDVSNANIQITPSTMFSQNDLVFISDCQTGDIFRVTNNPNGSGSSTTLTYGVGSNFTNRLSKEYGTEAEVMAYRSNTYFVRDTGRQNLIGQPIQALSVIDANGNRSDLLDGIEDMEIDYGEDLDNDGNADWYVDADQLGGGSGNAGNVVSVRINLLVRSVEGNITSQVVTINNFHGGAVNPADKRLRRVFASTTQMRNH